MNSRSIGPPPISPNGSEWSGYSHYRNMSNASPGFPPLHGGHMMSPPNSASSNGIAMPVPNGINTPRAGPSPPNSIGARSSYGTTMSSSDAKRRQTLQMEDRLSQHYTILRRFLGQALDEERNGARPNRAKDKLLRLSSVQFHELSTDIYDELLRRQSSQGQQTNGPGQVPTYLMPKQNFHPKRNQARQKLATLPPSRFRALAADIFFELEHRMPHLVGDVPRIGSPSIASPSRSGTPNSLRPPRNASMSGMGVDDDHSRPTARQFQSNTIIPNKGTMVEDDDEDALSDVYGNRRDTSYTSRSTGGTQEKDRKALAEFQSQVDDLQAKVRDLEDQARSKESEFVRVKESHSGVLSRHAEVQTSLEAKLRKAQELNSSLRSEIESIRQERTKVERDLRMQVSTLDTQAQGINEWRNRYDALDSSHKGLQDKLLQHEQRAAKSGEESRSYAEQLQALSERNKSFDAQEEQLRQQLRQAERNAEEWKTKYTQARTHGAPRLRGPQYDSSTQQLYLSPVGLVKFLHLTQFRTAIDGLLDVARSDTPKMVLAHVKHTVIAVRSITQDVSEGSGSGAFDAKTLATLETRVSSTATNLITAAKNFSVSAGLAPVSLLDAAASHLSMAIIALAMLVKVVPAPPNTVDDHRQLSIDPPPADDYYDEMTPRQLYHPANPVSVRSEVGSQSRNTPTLSTTATSKKDFGMVNGVDDSAPMDNGDGNDLLMLTSRVYTRPNKSTSSSISKSSSVGVTNDMGRQSQSSHHHQTSQASSTSAYQDTTSNGQHANSSTSRSTSVSSAQRLNSENTAKKRNSAIDALRSIVDSRTTNLLSTLQLLVTSIRSSAPPSDVLDAVANLTSTARQLIHQTVLTVEAGSRPAQIVQQMGELVEYLEEQGREGEEITNETQWREYVKRLPPIGFDIARRVKELGSWVDETEPSQIQINNATPNHESDDFS